jgi:hypothetical protein
LLSDKFDYRVVIDRMEGFDKIRDAYIAEQTAYIDAEIAVANEMIANEQDTTKLMDEIIAQISAKMVDEELREYTIPDIFEDISGLVVSAPEITRNGKPILSRYLSENSVDLIKIRNSPPYVNAESINTKTQIIMPYQHGELSYKENYIMKVKGLKEFVNIFPPQLIPVIATTHYKNNEVNLMTKKNSLLARIKFTRELLRQFRAVDIADRLTSFMTGKYQNVETKIKSDLLAQINSNMDLFTETVRRQAFYTNRLIGGMFGVPIEVTTGMITCEVNSLFRELVLAQVDISFDIVPTDFDISLTNNSIIDECNARIIILGIKKRQLGEI